jgi:import inner membrane translocase subunit TIM22
MGALYSFNECVIEKYRAKHDIVNPMLAGCATGGMMAYSGEA